MLTRIRNANSRKLKTVVIKRTKLTFNIAKILKQEGFIESFEDFGDVLLTEKGFVYKNLLVTLKYRGVRQKPYITFLKRISKPGLRLYINKRNIPKVLGGIGVAVFLLILLVLDIIV